MSTPIRTPSIKPESVSSSYGWRGAARVPANGFVLLLVVGGLGLGAYRWLRGPQVDAREITLGGEHLVRGTIAKDQCRMKCATASELCFVTTSPADHVALQQCQRTAVTCDDACSMPYTSGPPYFRYTYGAAPDWWTVLDRFDKGRAALAERCNFTASDTLDVYLSQPEGDPAHALVDHEAPEKAACASKELGPLLHEPVAYTKSYSFLATLSLGPIAWATLWGDANATASQAPSPGIRTRAERAMSAYSVRVDRVRQAQNAVMPEAPAEPIGAHGSFDQSLAADEARRREQARITREQEHQLDEERRFYEINKLRHDGEMMRKRGENLLVHEELSNQRLRGRVGYEGESYKREYRRDDRASSQATWDEVERLREKREADERRERYERERKVHRMEWEARMRRD